ncbi:hypothetical protein H4S07_005592 [Coemansia furcata]|uniref:Uncharacterized protein n=1 Tax=Coemansia furcata TaxID=417177 RepID=A0ACC1L0B6_9FUNG|nr:hypothetical protein H4S07_005592 [Coemansia furcata]
MSEHRADSNCPSPVEDARDGQHSQHSLVHDHYSSSQLGDIINHEDYSDELSDNGDEEVDNESDTFPSLFESGDSMADTDGRSEDSEDAGEVSPEHILIDTQYMPPEVPEGPIVIGDTQIPATYEENGPIVIGDTQMPSTIEIATSPIRAPYAREGTAGEGSARRDLKHRMSNASRAESEGAAENKKQKASGDKGDEGTKSPVPPTLRTRTQFKCAVCLETPDPAVFVHPCGHVFCEGCAQGAVQTTGKCPVCRHAMRARSIRVLQFRIAPIGRTPK